MLSKKQYLETVLTADQDTILKNYVAGEFITSDNLFDDINPVDGTLVAKVAEADHDLVNKAVQSAKSALKGEWGSIDVKKRCALLHAVADEIDRRFDDFVAAEVADTGKAYSQVKNIDIPRGAANFRIFADLIKTRPTQTFEMETPDGKGATSYVVNKPIGVVAVVSPWNLPLLLMTWKVAPALASGNTVVVKPSEETPSTATLLAEVMETVGIPIGVYNLVHGFGPGSAGEFLVGHKDVDCVTFTGETKTGTAIMKSAAEGLKPISFELGGKNAAIIFEDADFDAAVSGTVRSVFANCGQVCLCSERVYVQRPIFDKFVDALKEKAENIKIGKPEDGSDMGPLISAKHRVKVLSYFSLALEEGATLVTGGKIPSFGDERDNGSFIEPTIWTGLAEDARCVKEEIFGPVCHITPFDTEEDVVELANDTNYGLAAALWTTDANKADRVARQMEVGICWINDWFLRDLRTPFGGVKLSGIGREGGMHSLDFYSEPLTICNKR
ncbi:MAG: 2-hydroxymuconic semialdehyde dehydrogenase [Kordiimonadaceae bacterium]|nr:2-hydroxymuconic semialdehyde dehydrogenase [Kordiimonadaceae bacterium]MBT6032103.1 2-hydroxymuconic semialdehyde dehydrogenase [Kordiimonadaceae bacterium]